jgi:hypothetical protein
VLRELVLLVTLAPVAVALRGRCDVHGLVSLASSGVDEGALGELATGSGLVLPAWQDLASAAVTLALATAALPVATLILDRRGHVLASNEAWTRLSGLTAGASRGDCWTAAIAGPDPASVLAALSTAPAPERLRVTIASRWPSPGPSCVLVPRPLRDPRGALLGHVVSIVPTPTPAVAGSDEGPTEPVLEEARDAWVVRMAEALERHHGLPTTLGLLLVQVDVQDDPAGDVGVPDIDAEPTWQPVVDEAAVRDVTRRVALVDDAVDLTTRLGQGRFALLAQELTSYHEAVRLAGRLIEHLAHPLVAVGTTRPLRTSIGVAFPHLPGDAAEELMTNAERAVELAASLGGNRFEVIIGTGPGSSDAVVAPAPVSEPSTA